MLNKDKLQYLLKTKEGKQKVTDIPPKLPSEEKWETTYFSTKKINENLL